MEKIINIAVIAHVDAGKSTLVDAMLKQSGVFSEREEVVSQVMDSNALERERGITIYSKNCSINYKGVKINIVDTPGHADFSSEVERIMKTVDTVILLVDAKEGPMPQTRFVLEKSLEVGLKPILFINKIDKKDERSDEVVDMTFDLFLSLNATDEQLNFPIVYGIARDGIARLNKNDTNEDLTPLLDLIVNTVKPYEGNVNDPLQMQVSSLAYDEYIGRLGIGRITKGCIKVGEEVVVCRTDGSTERARITKLFVNEGIKRKEVKEAYYGDIVVVAGIKDVSIGETICDKDNVNPMEMIHIEEPTLSMNFLVNSSPFAGREGKFVTIRHIKDRLDRELETNVGLKVEPLDNLDGYKVYGRGELHLSILLENMRREGYELSVSKPEVILKEIDGVKCEPYEELQIEVPEENVGPVIEAIGLRGGTMENMTNVNNLVRLIYTIPSRGLIGFSTDFMTMTKGYGILNHTFSEYKKVENLTVGERKFGVLVSMENGKATAYSIGNLEDRGTMFIEPGTEVYEGMIVGECNRENDLAVNVVKGKQLTNTRAAGSDHTVVLKRPRPTPLEYCLEYINDDELVEITPLSVRLRKRILNTEARKKFDAKKLGN